MRLVMAFTLAVLLSGSAALASDAMGEVTHLVYDRANGSRLEFFGKWHHIYVWYPGSQKVFSGSWKTLPENSIVANRICMTFGKNETNPISRKADGKRVCTGFMDYTSNFQEMIWKDPFGLSRRKDAPFVLGTSRTSLKRLASRMGITLTDRVFTPEDLFMFPGQGGPSSKQLDILRQYATPK